MALWDLAGRKLGLPVYKLIGAYRDKVPAYASTMCGDEMPGGLATPGRLRALRRGAARARLPGDQAAHVDEARLLGARPKMDVRACAAVREAVGPDIPLMLDAYHGYSRSDALWLGREIQKLGYYWYEEPMNEASISSYAWLAANLDIPILGPETADGKFHTRAEWIKAGACDITRTGVMDVGGIGPSLKIIHLAESFGMDCEIHGGGAGNLTLCAVQKNGRWYERGMLHPFSTTTRCRSTCNARADAMDAEGFVHMPQIPGLGDDIDFDYIDNNLA